MLFPSLNRRPASRAALALLAGAAWLFVPAPPRAAVDASATSEPVVLQMWGMPFADLFTGFSLVIEEYDARHPGIRIERGSPGGQASLDPQKLMTAFVGQKPPDLVHMDRFQLAGWASRGVFLPLDDLMERDGVDREDFYPACIDECRYDGHTYGIPWNTDSRCLWVNMDVLAAHGYAAPPRDWNELAAMARTITRRTARGSIETLGFAPLLGNSFLYMYGWLNGGQFASADGRQVTLTDDRIVEALTWMRDTYAGIGGIGSVDDFSASAQTQGIAEPFLAGKIAMKIEGNWALDYLAKFGPNANLRVVPPPAPPGKTPISWSGGFCWSIPANAPNREEAWKLAMYLSSEEAWLRAGELQKQVNEAKARAQNLDAGYYIPQLSASKRINQAQIARFTGDLPEPVRLGFAAHVEILDVCFFRPILPVGKLYWDEQARAVDQVLRVNVQPRTALAAAQKKVQAALDQYYAPPRGVEYPIGRVFALLFAVVMAAIAAAWARAAMRWQWTPRTRGEAGAGLLFAAPWLFGFFALLLGPMLGSLLIAFSEYDMIKPARWVGFANFTELAGFMRNDEGTVVPRDPLFYKSLWNTAFVALIGVPLGILVSLGLALLLNKEVRGVRIYRTCFYLPVVVPTVATAILWMWLLNSETGLTGALLNPLLGAIGIGPIGFFSDPVFARLAIVLMVTWTAGSSMIIWLAGLKGIPQTYYEAASIDGAGTMQTFFRITLPLLSPYLFFNIVIGIIGWLQIFTQAYVLTQPPPYGPADSLLFYVFYLFVQAFQYFHMGLACAMAWILFLLVAGLTWLQFRIAPRWVNYEV